MFRRNKLIAELLQDKDAGVRQTAVQTMQQFGTAGHAAKIKVIPLAEMARRYRAGSLDPRIGDMATAAE